MRARRIIRRTLAAAALAALLGAVFIYAMVSRIPPAYKPMHLTLEQQQAGMRKFVNHVGEFGEKAGRGEPFAWTITAAQANEYIASMDAIASLPREKPVHPLARIEQAGYAAPAVAMRPGVLTVMVKLRRHNKIFGADLTFHFDDDGDLTARVAAVRVGTMPMPQGWVRRRLDRSKQALKEYFAQAKETGGGLIGPLRMRDLAELLRRVVEMMEGRHVRPEILWPLGRHRVLIRRVEITDGALTLHAVPVDRRRTRAAAGPAPGRIWVTKPRFAAYHYGGLTGGRRRRRVWDQSRGVRP